MESHIGALLTKISAIIDFIAAAIIFIIGFIAMAGIVIFPRLSGILSFILILVGAIVLVFGFIIWHAAKLMENPRTVKNGAIWAIVLGALTVGNISGILALIGGIIALVESEKTEKRR